MPPTPPPLQPTYILRGHAAPLHTVHFLAPTRLATADADGWLVIWDLASKRPIAVWRAHDGAAVLAVGNWGGFGSEEGGKVITHGKDNKLIVWKLPPENESSLSTVLPVDSSPITRPQPWILHILHVNTMNFCSFASHEPPSSSASNSEPELLIAVPNTLSSETVDIFHLPTTNRIHTIPSPPSLRPSPSNPTQKGGMIMALSLFTHPSSAELTVIAGYESGHTVISSLSPSNNTWATIYTAHSHAQPILSLSISLSDNCYFTSSADANIAKHPIPAAVLVDDDVEEIKREGPAAGGADGELKILKTGHSGQQSLQVRNDGKIFATAGWDGRVRVYAVKTMRELAVLKWHKEGCYAVAFADVNVDVDGLSGLAHDRNKGEDGREGKELVGRIGALTVKQERLRKAETTHWLAVGSKDGKVSLWDIY